ncbi:MAG: transposase family protein [Gammaproteobacteria bacterium]|nr:transposase family protein [Gammaproteobacteria bacterium]
MIQGLLEHFISRFGCPLYIHSDNGKEFTNQLLEKLLTRLEVAHTGLQPPIQQCKEVSPDVDID